jgi:hypothetical protein
MPAQAGIQYPLTFGCRTAVPTTAAADYWIIRLRG